MDFRYGVPVSDDTKTLDRLYRRLRNARQRGDLAGAAIIEGRIADLTDRLVNTARPSYRGLD